MFGARRVAMDPTAGGVGRDRGRGQERQKDALPRALLRYMDVVDAPSAEAAAEVHRRAHGLVADEIFPVVEGE